MDAINGYFDTIFGLVEWFVGSSIFFIVAGIIVVWFIVKNIKGRGE